jgi:hypothetical protein
MRLSDSRDINSYKFVPRVGLDAKSEVHTLVCAQNTLVGTNVLLSVFLSLLTVQNSNYGFVTSVGDAQALSFKIEMGR